MGSLRRLRSRGHGRQLIASAIALVMLVGFTTWFRDYTINFPISSMQLGIRVTHVFEEEHSTYNATFVMFNLTVYNPTNVDALPFEVESYDILVNGTRLVPWTYGLTNYYCHTGSYYGLTRMFVGEGGIPAHETRTFIDCELRIYWESTRTEGGDLSTVLSALNQSRFSFTFRGLMVVRTSYRTSADSVLGSIVAAFPFEASFVDT